MVCNYDSKYTEPLLGFQNPGTLWGGRQNVHNRFCTYISFLKTQIPAFDDVKFQLALLLEVVDSAPMSLQAFTRPYLSFYHGLKKIWKNLLKKILPYTSKITRMKIFLTCYPLFLNWLSLKAVLRHCFTLLSWLRC